MVAFADGLNWHVIVLILFWFLGTRFFSALFYFILSFLGELMEKISIIPSYDLQEENSRFIKLIFFFFCLIHLYLTTGNSYMGSMIVVWGLMECFCLGCLNCTVWYITLPSFLLGYTTQTSGKSLSAFTSLILCLRRVTQENPIPTCVFAGKHRHYRVIIRQAVRCTNALGDKMS